MTNDIYCDLKLQIYISYQWSSETILFPSCVVKVDVIMWGPDVVIGCSVSPARRPLQESPQTTELETLCRWKRSHQEATNWGSAEIITVCVCVCVCCMLWFTADSVQLKGQMGRFTSSHPGSERFDFISWLFFMNGSWITEAVMWWGRSRGHMTASGIIWLIFTTICPSWFMLMAVWALKQQTAAFIKTTGVQEHSGFNVAKLETLYSEKKKKPSVYPDTHQFMLRVIRETVRLERKRGKRRWPCRGRTLETLESRHS